ERRLEELRTVLEQEGDDVAATETCLEQGATECVHALGELAVRQPPARERDDGPVRPALDVPVEDAAVVQQRPGSTRTRSGAPASCSMRPNPPVTRSG